MSDEENHTYGESVGELAVRMRSCADMLDRHRGTVEADRPGDMDLVLSAASVASSALLMAETARELVGALGDALPEEYRWMIDGEGTP